MPRDDGGPVYLTQDAIERIKRTIHDLEKKQRPIAVDDVSRTVALGDLSENAEYQEAKFRLRNIDGRLFGLKDRLRRAVVIQKDAENDGRVTIGSTVTVVRDGKETTYTLVGEVETAPAKGFLSFKSPLGSSLMGKRSDDVVEITTPAGTASYRITTVF